MRPVYDEEVQAICDEIESPRIDVGSPATYGIGSDSYPATVVAVKRNDRDEITSVTIQRDKTAVAGLALVAAEWNGSPRPKGANISIPDPKGELMTFTRRKNGVLVLKGRPMASPCGYVALGVRRFYQDPSF